MEWAIGKGYDRYADGTGKLIKPGQKISWDQHVHAVGEEVTAGSELGIWLYPKGQEPKHRSYLIGFTGLKNGAAGLDIPPNSVAHTEGFTVLKENTVITNFQPHFHLRGKAMQVEAILPDGSNQIISYVDNFNFNWMTNYIYADDAAPAFPKGTVIHVTAFYDNTKANKNNPDPDQWVGLRRPHGGRNGPRVDERRLPHRHRIPGVAGRAQEAGRHARTSSNSSRRHLTPEGQRARVLFRGFSSFCAHAQLAIRQVRPRLEPRGLVMNRTIASGGWSRRCRSWLVARWCRPRSSCLQRPSKQFGASITPAYEGWFDNPDGTHNFLIGYYSRNTQAEVDIPIGPNNHFEPGNRRHGPADALPHPPALRHVRRDHAEGVRQDPEDHLDADRQRRDDQRAVPHAHRLQHHAVQVVGGESESRVQPSAGAALRGERSDARRDRWRRSADALERTATVGTPMPLDFWADDDALVQQRRQRAADRRAAAGQPHHLQVSRPRQRSPSPTRPSKFDRAQGREAGRAVLAARRPPPSPSASPATTCCTSPPTTTRATAAAAPAAAGRR